MEANRRRSRGERILVVDDEANARNALAEILKEEGYSRLVDLTAVDYPSRQARFELNYLLYHMRDRAWVRVKSQTADSAPSITPIFSGANTYEREVYDMYGVRFSGHPDPRRILMPSVAPSLVAGTILVFMIAFTELTVSALLWSTGHETLGVVVFMLHGEGNTTGAAALAVLMILVITMLAFIMSAVSRWLPKGVVPWQA